jgi:hypothetical protein
MQERKHLLGLKIDEKRLAKIKSLSTASRLSVSDYLRRLIDVAIKEKAYVNPKVINSRGGEFKP